MRWVIYILCLLPVISHAQQVDTLIQSLADPDATRRQAAENQLNRMGIEARPALVAASRGPDPAIASASARILLSLPWYRATDPPQVQLALANYGALDEPGRITIVGQLARMDRNLGLPAMLRLVQEDPSEDVSWAIVTTLTRTADRRRPPPVMTGLVQEQIRHLNPPDNRPAALVLGAYGWLNSDRPRAINMLQRAVDTETRFPTYDNGELDFAFDFLVDAATSSGRYDDAANLRRAQTSRIGVTRATYPSPIYHLFILHARYGPLQGLERDVAAFEEYLKSPQVMYALAEAYERGGRKLEAMACRQAALASSFAPETRADSGNFLTQTGWVDSARLEFYSINRSDSQAHRFDAIWRLANLASRDDADAVAIEHYKSLRDLGGALNINWPELIERFNLSESFPADEIPWRQARIALSQGNAAQANAAFDELMALGSSDTDVVQHSYPMLVNLGRQADALKLYEAGEKRLRESMKEQPDAPVWWNDLAWLSARCDQKLDEALELSKRAVAADPDNAAYLDTLAEVYFRRGQAAEAVKLETRALQIEPGDIFMTKQLERFKAGVKP